MEDKKRFIKYKPQALNLSLDRLPLFSTINWKKLNT